VEALGLALGLAHESLPGDPDGHVAGGEQRRVPIAIALEGRVTLVKLSAVEFDDHLRTLLRGDSHRTFEHRGEDLVRRFAARIVAR